MNIDQRQCHTDQILTDAALRGVRHISWNKEILALQQDITALTEINRRYDIRPAGTASAPSTVDILKEREHNMHRQAIDWITQVGFTPSKTYAITILVEEISE
jgi:hypothetical protein